MFEVSYQKKWKLDKADAGLRSEEPYIFWAVKQSLLLSHWSLLHDNTCAMFSPSSRGHAKVLGAYYDGQDTMYVTQGDRGTQGERAEAWLCCDLLTPQEIDTMEDVDNLLTHMLGVRWRRIIV